MRRSLRRTAGPAALVAAAVVLAGCDVATEAGAAAVVGDERIPISRVQDLTGQLLDGGVADPGTGAPVAEGEAQRRIVSSLVTSELLRQAAEEEGVAVSQGDVDALYATLVQQAGGEEALAEAFPQQAGVPASYGREYLRDQLTAQALGEALVPGPDQDPQVAEQRNAALFEVIAGGGEDVELNPRYGRWDAAQVAIEELPSGGLAVDPDAGDGTGDVPELVPAP